LEELEVGVEKEKAVPFCPGDFAEDAVLDEASDELIGGRGGDVCGLGDHLGIDPDLGEEGLEESQTRSRLRLPGCDLRFPSILELKDGVLDRQLPAGIRLRPYATSCEKTVRSRCGYFSIMC